MAADLGQPPVVASVYDWTGFYFGGNGGYGLGNSSTNYTALGSNPFSTSQSMTVSTPGTGAFPTLNTGAHVTESIVRVGVNYQFGAPVVPKY